MSYTEEFVLSSVHMSNFSGNFSGNTFLVDSANAIYRRCNRSHTKAFERTDFDLFTPSVRRKVPRKVACVNTALGLCEYRGMST